MVLSTLGINPEAAKTIRFVVIVKRKIVIVFSVNLTEIQRYKYME